MIRKMLVIGLLFLTVGSAVAGTSGYYFSGTGLPEYPNEGVMWASAKTVATELDPITVPCEQLYTEYYDPKGNNVNYYYSGNAYAYYTSTTHGVVIWNTEGSGASTLCDAVPDVIYTSDTCSFIGSLLSTTLKKRFSSYTTHTSGKFTCAPGYCQSANAWVRVMITSDSVYNVSGTTGCLSNVSLYYNGDKIDYNDNLTEADYYIFYHLIDSETYKLVFDNGHEYEFTVNGSDTVYNYDGCIHTTYHLKESCSNLIPDSEGYFCENWVGGGGICRNFYESNGILDISNTTALTMEIYTDTFIGETGWTINPVVDGTVYVLENPNIAWGLKVIVQNDTDGTLIDGAMVKVNQDCYCTSGYSTRQKMSVSGMASFTDMSLQDASLLVMKTGYKPIDENSTGYAATLSGRSNFSSKTWVVKLAPSSSNNSSSFYEVSNKVDIHFVDVNGNRTSQILDTDSEVYLYYENNNTEEEAMSLKFQSSSTHTYFINEQSWTIAHDGIGHKTIANSYFTPWDYSYRAVIYNSSIHGWNITIPLTVRNETKEVDQHYKNLTTLLFFMYASDGKVDFRDNMRVGIHACSNNTTLMTVDVELWKDGVYIACNNLTGTDFTKASYPYYVMWDPVFDYVTGSNYSVRMYGFDRTLLKTDYVECVTDDTTRKNKLTVAVKDKFGHNVDNAYIYLEGWGSLSTGSTYYNAYEGIDNGDYRYKATKSGYTGGGWDDVNITDEDKIVWYVLSEDYTNTSVAVQKFTDDDIKGFFFPLMFFLLICIVLGGLKYVAY